MAEFSHVIELSKEEVEQAVLDLALKKAVPRGLAIDSYAVHTRASVTVIAEAGAIQITGARISWKDE